MSNSPPPIYEILSEQNGKARLPWILFFNQIFAGDSGTDWTPVFVNLTIIGTPSITGKYYRNGRFIDFWVKIVPATSTTSVAGTTYIDPLPFKVTTDTVCHAIAGTTGVDFGVVKSSNNRIYVPSWAALAVPLTITGRAEAN